MAENTNTGIYMTINDGAIAGTSARVKNAFDISSGPVYHAYRSHNFAANGLLTTSEMKNECLIFSVQKDTADSSIIRKALHSKELQTFKTIVFDFYKTDTSAEGAAFKTIAFKYATITNGSSGPGFILAYRAVCETFNDTDADGQAGKDYEWAFDYVTQKSMSKEEFDSL
jgi:type VI protein secretion system component Hcp